MQSRKNCHFVVSIFCFYTTVTDPGKKVLSRKPAPSMLQATFFGFKTPVFLQLNAEDRPVFCAVCTSFAKSTRGTETKMAGQTNLFLQTWLNMEGFGQKWTTAPFTESFVEVLPHSYCPQLLQGDHSDIVAAAVYHLLGCLKKWKEQEEPQKSKEPIGATKNVYAEDPFAGYKWMIRTILVTFPFKGAEDSL